MFKYLGKPTVKITVCFAPRLHGIRDALDWAQIVPILRQYGMIDMFLLLVDRDGDANRRGSLDYLEKKAKELLPPQKAFLAELAHQEIEVWALAAHELPSQWNWRAVVADSDPKERYFKPLANQSGIAKNESGGLYMAMSRPIAANYPRIRQLCPELAELEQRITTWLNSQP